MKQKKLTEVDFARAAALARSILRIIEPPNRVVGSIPSATDAEDAIYLSEQLTWRLEDLVERSIE